MAPTSVNGTANATASGCRRRCGLGLAAACLAATVGCTVKAAAGSAAAATGAPFSVEEATIADIQQAILSRRVTTTDIVKLYLTRIKAYNGTCVNQPDGLLGPISAIPHAGQLNALGTLNLRPATRKAWGFDDHHARTMTDAADNDPAMPDALETAGEQDREFARTGKLVGPLQGVVVAVKEWYDTVDMRSTGGADIAYANDRPPHDTTIVARLRKQGAIILAKSNVGGFNSRSPFGGTVCNAYDTERTPRGSSSGSAVSVAANLVTCAIGEETGTSIRIPSSSSNVVGLSPTVELTSRTGMTGEGLTTRTGPICRTVEDAARMLTAEIGYDAKNPLSAYDAADPMTAFGVGRLPAQPYETSARGDRLDGLRIGVIREYMDVRLFSKRDQAVIDVVDRAVADLHRTGATIVDPGPGGALMTACFHKYVPEAFGKLFTEQHPDLFPVDATGKPTADHLAKLVEMKANPDLVPDGPTIRDLGPVQAVGDSAYWKALYLHDRHDAAVKTTEEANAATKPIADPVFRASSANITTSAPYGSPSGRAGGGNAPQAPELDMADRMLQRFAFQQVVLSCMADLQLDALVYPTNNIPPEKIQAPEEPAVNGRNQAHWTLLGQNGFPTITVPAGFTTQIYDRVPDPASPDGTGTRMVGPVAARLPVGVDFAARPFGEPTLVRIAAAYEKVTKHREVPPEFHGLPPAAGK
jgi:Asp-tRNA(Asn)/Glu-tRNA(Gln) amidotransferase A subunit family amidase